MGIAGSRRFWKSEPFSSAICPKPAWSYDTAVGKYYDWLFRMKNTQMLATTGETDEYYLYNTYPAKLIRLYLALYRAEGRALDLAKARALGNAVTHIQKIAGNGAIPTHWVKWDVESDAKHWINCGIGTAQALEELFKIEKPKP